MNAPSSSSRAAASSGRGSSIADLLAKRGISTANLRPVSLGRALEEPLEQPVHESISTCSFCRRTSVDENPCPRRHPGTHLVFATVSECLPCRNYINGVRVDVKRPQLRKNLKEKDNFDQFLDCLHKCEQLFDSMPAGKQLRDMAGKIQLPDFITVSETRASGGTTFLGNLLPVDVLQREEIAFKSEDLEEYNGLLGIFKDDSVAKALGGIVVYHDKRKEVTRTKEQANNHVDEVWRPIQEKASVAPSVSKKKAEDGSISYQLRRKAEPMEKDDDDDSWDADLLGTFNMPTKESGESTKSGLGKRRKVTKAPSASQNTSSRSHTKKMLSPTKKLFTKTAGRGHVPRAAASSASSVKVYPSVQLRVIMKMEELAVEAGSVLELLRNEETFKSTNHEKLRAMESKVEGRLTNEVFAAQVVAQNIITKENGIDEDLRNRGLQVLASLGTQKEQLGAAVMLVQSFECHDEFALSACPSFLHKAYLHACTLHVNPDLSTFWDTATNDTEGILAVLNSESAKYLKDAWTPLINAKHLLTFFLTELNVEKFSYVEDSIKTVNEGLSSEGMDRDFNVARDKVSEISCAKAYARPLRKGEERSVVLTGALETVAKLDGEIPPKLGMLIQSQITAVD